MLLSETNKLLDTRCELTPPPPVERKDGVDGGF